MCGMDKVFWVLCDTYSKSNVALLRSCLLILTASADPLPGEITLPRTNSWFPIFSRWTLANLSVGIDQTITALFYCPAWSCKQKTAAEIL